MAIKDTIRKRFTNFKIFALKIKMLSDLRMSLLHSDIADGKNEFLQKVETNFKLRNAVTVSGLIAMVLFGNRIKQIARELVFKNFEKRLQSCLYYRLC